MDTLVDRAASCAREIAEQYGEVVALTRFPTGLCHFVHDVVLADGGQLVVRIGSPENRHLLAGAVAWSQLLRPLGVPLPELLAHDVDAVPLPYVVLERLPGDDLGVVLPGLSAQQRRAIARAVAEIQLHVGNLGAADGYGYSPDPGSRPPLRSWAEVVLENLSRSGDRLARSSAQIRDLHARVLHRATDLQDELAAVPATPFLDDLTTKNVIVQDGRPTGVVDVDVVCFGDPLFTPALTRVSLVASEQPTDYVDAWLETLGVSGGLLFDLYCGVFCLDLLSEHGQRFNRDEPEVVDPPRTERLLALAGAVLG